MTPTFSSPNLRQLFDLSRRGNIQAGGACTTWRWWVNLSRSRILTCYRRYYLLPLNKLKSTETGMVHGPRIQIESGARRDVASELDPHFAKTFAYALHDLYHCIMCPVLLASTTQIFACYGTVCALKILKSIRSNKTFQGGVRKSKLIPSASNRNLAFHNEVGVTPAARSERSDVYCDSTCRCSCMFHHRKQGSQTTSISAICCAALLLNISLAAECPPAAVSFRRLFNAFFLSCLFMSFYGHTMPNKCTVSNPKNFIQILT